MGAMILELSIIHVYFFRDAKWYLAYQFTLSRGSLPILAAVPQILDYALSTVGLNRSIPVSTMLRNPQETADQDGPNGQIVQDLQQRLDSYSQEGILERENLIKRKKEKKERYFNRFAIFPRAGMWAIRNCKRPPLGFNWECRD